MNIGIDYDGTITEYPNHFKTLTETLSRGGWFIYVITGRPEIFRIQTEMELRHMAITYDQLIMASDNITGVPLRHHALQHKIQACVSFKIEMVIDNDIQCVQSLARSGILSLWVGTPAQPTTKEEPSKRAENKPRLAGIRKG